MIRFSGLDYSSNNFVTFSSNRSKINRVASKTSFFFSKNLPTFDTVNK